MTCNRSTVHHGDCLEVLLTLAESSIDAVVTDPPYHLTTGKKGGTGLASDNPNSPAGRSRVTTGFMGKAWDGGDVAMRQETWAKVLRVAKPGAHLLAFGGTRTFHRLTCAIEDAGWEIRDCIMWVYGSGFPKSHNGPWGGTALKPAWEPIIVARKPLVGTVAANVQEHGTGGLNIDGCRVEWSKPDTTRGAGGQNGRYGELGAQGRIEDDGKGRWPANLIHDGSDEVLAGFPQAKGQQGAVGPQYGDKSSVNAFGDFGPRENFHPRGDVGSAARFFKTCAFDENERLFWRATSIIQAWNSDLANTADNASRLPREHVDSVLKRVVIAASQGDRLLSDVPELSTSVTPNELRRISETLIAMILNSESECSPVSPLARHFPNGCRANCVVHKNQTATITITISHWKSDGSADAAIFNIMPLNSERGAKDFLSGSRFTYCAKASKSDRDEGLEACDNKVLARSCQAQAEADRGNVVDEEGGGFNKARIRKNNHPTVKPTALMRYLCRLVTPPGGIVLDPFAGSGSTGKAAVAEGFRFVGIERNPEYVELARRRSAGGVNEQGAFHGW